MRTRSSSFESYLLVLTSRLPACTGELRHIQKLRYWPLDVVLVDKYLLPKDQAELIASFLTPMLRLHPEKRAKAHELVHHKLLDGVVVQGEIDLIRKREDEEVRKRVEDAFESGDNKVMLDAERRVRYAEAEERHHMEEDHDADALKPVGDLMSQEDGLDGLKKDAVVTSSKAHKENQRVSHSSHGQHANHSQGHKHTSSRGSNIYIDTSGNQFRDHKVSK